MTLSLKQLVDNRDTVVEFARRTQNPLYAKQLERYDEVVEEYARVLERLLMAVKLADADGLEAMIVDAENWARMTPSERQSYRIKHGLWTIGSVAKDGL